MSRNLYIRMELKTGTHVQKAKGLVEDLEGCEYGMVASCQLRDGAADEELLRNTLIEGFALCLFHQRANIHITKLNMDWKRAGHGERLAFLQEAERTLIQSGTIKPPTPPLTPEQIDADKRAVEIAAATLFVAEHPEVLWANATGGFPDEYRDRARGILLSNGLLNAKT